LSQNIQKDDSTAESEYIRKEWKMILHIRQKSYETPEVTYNIGDEFLDPLRK
jgi:hypothetical protein